MIRKAKVTDAEGFCNVVRISIVELCELDHKNDQKRLDEWLENKTVQNCEKWIVGENANSFVAEENGEIVGISHIGSNGHLFLCYVLPKVKGKGFGGQLLLAAENSVMNLGLKSLTVESSVTSKGFYEHYDYVSMGVAGHCLAYAKSIK